MPHTVEEAYEVADAALAGDDAKLLDEIGDLLFQSYFLALLLEERGAGDLEAAARGDPREARRAAIRTSSATSRPRRPGACGSAGSEIKREQEGREGIFHDVPEALPGAALRAEGAAARARRSASSTRISRAPSPTSTTSCASCTSELDDPGRSRARAAAELGDVLFAAVNVARKLNVDPELELRAAAKRFRERVEAARAARRRRTARIGRASAR